MKSGIIKFLLSFFIVIFTVIFIFKDSQLQREKNISNISKSEVLREIKDLESYNKKGNYILNMDEAHYFLTKKDGYKYNEPKNIKYFSKVTGEYRNLKVLLPTTYDKNKYYPVLFLLHGHEGDENSWINKKAHILIQNLSYFQNSKDKIVVFVNSRLKKKKMKWYESYYEDVTAFDKTKDELYLSVLPLISKKYKISQNIKDRAIAGFSLGARNALNIGLSKKSTFGYIGAFSPEEIFEGHKKLPQVLKAEDIDVENKYIEISTGREDDDTIKGTKAIVDSFNKKKIDFNYYDMKGSHEVKVWQNSLYNFILRWK